MLEPVWSQSTTEYQLLTKINTGLVEMAWSDDEIDSLFNMNSVEFLPKQLLEVKNNRIYGAATVTPTALFDAQRIGNAAKGLVRLGT